VGGAEQVGPDRGDVVAAEEVPWPARRGRLVGAELSGLDPPVQHRAVDAQGVVEGAQRDQVFLGVGRAPGRDRGAVGRGGLGEPARAGRGLGLVLAEEGFVEPRGVGGDAEPVAQHHAHHLVAADRGDAGDGARSLALGLARSPPS